MVSKIAMKTSGPGETGSARRPPILVSLENNIGHLPDALARIAKYIVENPEKVINHSLADISHYSKSGNASVIRLCKNLGFKGFKELKISLAGELARQPTLNSSHPDGGRSPYGRLAGTICKSITGTENLLDPRLIRLLMQRLRECVRIDLYGAGASGIAAELMAFRLLRVGLNAHAIRDANMAHEVVNGLGPKAAAIAISDSGVSLDTVDFLKSARSAKALTVAITCRSKSPLTDHADFVIPMANVGELSYRGHVSTVPRVVLIAEIMAEELEKSNS